MVDIASGNPNDPPEAREFAPTTSHAEDELNALQLLSALPMRFASSTHAAIHNMELDLAPLLAIK